MSIKINKIIKQVYKFIFALSLVMVCVPSMAIMTDKSMMSADNSMFAMALKKDEDSVPYINIYKVDTGSFVSKITGIERGLTSLTISPDGSRVLVADFEDNLMLFDSKTGKLINKRKVSNLNEVFFKNNDIVTISENAVYTFEAELANLISKDDFGNDSLLYITSLNKAKKILSSNFKYMPFKKYGTQFRFFQIDGKFLFNYDGDQFVLVLDANTQKLLGTINSEIFSFDFIPSPKKNEIWLYDDKKIEIWNTATQKQQAMLELAPLPFEEISNIIFTKDGKQAVLAVSVDDHKSNLIILDTNTYQVQKTIEFKDFIADMKMINNHTVLLDGDNPSMWDIKNNKVVTLFKKQ